MGYGLIANCKKCKYIERFYLGVGMTLPKVYRQIVEAVRSGKYGKEWQIFFEENTNAAIMVDRRLYQCTSCNHLEQDYDLSLYLNKNGTSPEHDDWPHWDASSHKYEFVKSYVHKCPKCSSIMRKVTDYNKTGLPCPECGENLVLEDGTCWD